MSSQSGPEHIIHTTFAVITTRYKSHLAMGGIALLYFPLTVWLQFTIACFGWGFDPQISFFFEGSGTPI